jgi:hypothetical protein
VEKNKYPPRPPHQGDVPALSVCLKYRQQNRGTYNETKNKETLNKKNYDTQKIIITARAAHDGSIGRVGRGSDDWRRYWDYLLFPHRQLL